MDKSLSLKDLQSLTDANVITYESVHECETLDDLMRNDCCILLYFSTPNYGHWVTILRYPDHIEFFDPLAQYPDKMLESVDPSVNRHYHQNHTYLLKLLYETQLPVEYNNYKLQEMSPLISTCGRHAIVRCLCRDIKLDDYVRVMRKLAGENYLDDLVYNFTKNYV